MALKSGASKGAKNLNSFDEEDTNKAAGQKIAWSPFSGGTKYNSYDNPGEGSVPPRYPDESIKSYNKRRYNPELYK